MDISCYCEKNFLHEINISAIPQYDSLVREMSEAEYGFWFIMVKHHKNIYL